MDAVSFIYLNLSPHCNLFNISWIYFLYTRSVAFSHHYHRQQFYFLSKLSISLSPMSVPTGLDRW